MYERAGRVGCAAEAYELTHSHRLQGWLVLESASVSYGKATSYLPVIGEFLDVLLGEDPGLAPLKQLLVKRGDPFFLEETVRTLVETKALTGERARYRLTQPLQAIQVPPTAQVMLAARIDRLPAEERRLLQTASVVGKDAAQAIAELPDEALRRGLDHLQSAEFVYKSGLFPDLEYAKRGIPHRAVIYEPWPTGQAWEHSDAISFSPRGAEIWEKDVIEFSRYLTAPESPAIDRAAISSASETNDPGAGSSRIAPAGSALQNPQ